MESESTSIDSDGDGLDGKSLKERVLVEGFDVRESGDGCLGFTLSCAFTVSSGVRVGRTSRDTVVDDVVEGVVHQTTVASGVFSVTSSLSGAINEFLLGEGGGGLFDSVETLNCTDSGEGPA